MRRLILLAAVVACGLLAGPAGAQDADPCDVNPDAPECNVPPIAIQPAPSCPGGGFVLVVFGEALAPVCFPPPAPAAPVAPAAPTTVIQQTIVQQVVAAPIIPAVQPAGCGDSRRNFTVRLPGRFHTYTRVRVMFGGIVQHGDGQSTVAVGQDRRINVDMRGFKCGVYALIVRQGHKAPVVRIYTAGPHGNLTNLNVALAQARRARAASNVISPWCREDDPCWVWSAMGNRSRGVVTVDGARLRVGPCRFRRLREAHQIDWARTPHLRGDYIAARNGCRR